MIACNNSFFVYYVCGCVHISGGDVFGPELFAYVLHTDTILIIRVCVYIRVLGNDGPFENLL